MRFLSSGARLSSVALAQALCGDVAAAQSLANGISGVNPHSTLSNFIWSPVILAAIELQRGNAALAIQTLAPTIPYESAALFWPNYLRGQAYLRLEKGSEAAVEFRKILGHRGWDALSPLFPLAHLGMARAAALTGDDAGRREAHQAFLALWKDADPEIPHLQEVKREQAHFPSDSN